MLYSILIYGSEDRAAAWTAEEEKEVMDLHAALRANLTANSRLGPVMRLVPQQAKTVRRGRPVKEVTDGPFAETKEQLMGLYVIECATFEEALAAVEQLDFETGVFEITPLVYMDPGLLPPVIPAK